MIALIDTYKKELLQVAVFTDKTVANYLSCLVKYFEYLKDELKIDPIKHCDKYVAKWLIILKKEGIGTSRLMHHQCALKGFLDFLVKMKVIKQSPLKKIVTMKKRPSELNKPIPTETAYRLLRSISQSTWLGKRNFLIISIFWALGLRLTELLNLKVGSFEVQEQGKMIGVLKVQGKNRKERILFVVDLLFEVVTKYLSNPESPKNKNDFLFPGKNGHISVDQVLAMIKEYAKKAGIKERITPRVLRHCFATEMYDKGVPIEAIRDMMGHVSIAETALYVHVSDEMKQLALEQISISGDISWKR